MTGRYEQQTCPDASSAPALCREAASRRNAVAPLAAWCRGAAARPSAPPPWQAWRPRGAQCCRAVMRGEGEDTAVWMCSAQHLAACLLPHPHSCVHTIRCSSQGGSSDSEARQYTPAASRATLRAPPPTPTAIVPAHLTGDWETFLIDPPHGDAPCLHLMGLWRCAGFSIRPCTDYTPVPLTPDSRPVRSACKQRVRCMSFSPPHRCRDERACWQASPPNAAI